MISAIVLAAGSSSRLGRPKQLLSFRGEPLLRAIVREACGAKCDRVAVVLSVGDEASRAAILGLPVTIKDNPASHEGMGSSIRVGVAWASADPANDGVVMIACDQPALRSAHIDALVAAADVDGRLRAVASRYGGVLGIPALFPRSRFAALLGLRSGEGARDVLRASPDLASVDWPAGAFDVDTPADAEQLEGGGL